MNPETVSKATVLVVAQDLEFRFVFCRTLCEAGYQVSYATSYAEGLVFLDHHPVEFVIVSQGTSAFEGRTVLERAIEKNRRLPVIVLTSSLDIDVYLEAIQLGALDYLEMPVNTDIILKCIRAHTLKPAHQMD